jgi:hypothetical protein
LQITNLPGVVDVPLLNISFQSPNESITVGANGQVTNPTIMHFDTALAPPRWVALPTFVDPSAHRLFTSARLSGKNIALFRQ